MRFGFGFAAAAVVAALLGAAMFLLPNYAAPPINSEQIGFRGTGMVTVSEAREDAKILAANAVAPPSLPLVTTGPKASEVYENVQVLGDLSQSQFTRLMLAITQWVSPDQGCTYCHAAGEGFASDTLYTKRVARWMVQMTRHINNDWTDHVANIGVTCNTCHRGHNVPQYVWYEPEISGPEPGSNGLLGYYKELYGPSAMAGLSSLNMNPLTPYLDDDAEIRVVSNTALPTTNNASTKQTERTYALMMHMSQSLGVNCTYCHNTRAFTAWEQSPPQRTTAWYGIRMVRDINNAYLEPIRDTLPPYRLGPHGDVPKTNCTTCHQGLNKPLNGVSMLDDYPSLAAANVATLEELLPRTLQAMPVEDTAAAEPAATEQTAQTTGEGQTVDEATEESQDAAEDAGLASPDPEEAADADNAEPGEETQAVPLERAPAEGAAPAGTQPAPTQDAAPPEGDASEATTTPGIPVAGSEAVEESQEADPEEAPAAQ